MTVTRSPSSPFCSAAIKILSLPFASRPSLLASFLSPPERQGSVAPSFPIPTPPHRSQQPSYRDPEQTHSLGTTQEARARASSAMAEAAAGTAPAQQQQAAARVATTTAAAAASDVSASAWLQQVLALLFPSNLAAKAALFALVVALLPLLPSGQAQEAPRIWELPHLLLLGIILSYGVFGQKNADDGAEVAAAAAGAAADDAKLLPGVVDDEAAVEAYVSQMMRGPLVFEENDGGGDDVDGASNDGGVQQAWSSQYLADDPLVVVADTSAPGTTTSGNGVITDTGEKPLLLPVRKLKPAAAEESAPAATPAGDMMMSDGSGIEEEEEEELLLAPKAGPGSGYDVVREHAIPSPSSVLDADLTLSPSSPPLLPPPPPPPPPPFLGRGRRRGLLKAKARSFNEFGALSRGDRSPNANLGSAGSKQFRSRSAVQATRRSAFGRRYDPVVPIDDEADDETLRDEMVAASDISSFSSDLDDDDTIIKEEENSCEDNGVDEDDEDGNSCDEELFELAMRPGPETETETEVEDEVDRKADEFIAKFREQIRMQRVEPARR